MTAAEAHERKLRDLVETAGFVLAVSLDHPGMFRVATAQLVSVGTASVSGRGFRVFFPGKQVQVSTASDLVDALETMKEES